MTRRIVVHRALLVPLAVLAIHLGASPARASDKWTEDKEPVYAQPDPGKALVYVLRDKSIPDPFLGAFEVFLDDVPLGYLKGRKYLHAQADPGTRLLWGPKEGHPVSVVLEAGTTYVFRIDEVWNTRVNRTGSNILVATYWRQEDAEALRGLVERSRLEHVAVTAAGVQNLRLDAPKRIDEARRAAVPLGGTPAAPTAPAGLTLPHTFEGVLYRPEKVGFQLKVFKSKGALTVSADGMDFASEDDHVAIAIADVRSISRGPLGVNRDMSWVIVEYASPAGTQVAGFAHRTFGSGIEATIRGALDQKRLSPLDQVRKAVAAAVKFEETGSMNAPDLESQLGAYGAADDIRKELLRVDPTLTAHLKEHPDDVEGLFLQARLDRGLLMLGPTVISAGKVQDDPLGPRRDPHAALDRILTLQPANAEAHYLKARLYGVLDPLTGKMKDADKALEQAGLAVQAEPGQMRYREALALYMMGNGREDDARQVFLKAGRADHPIVVLMEDRARLPVPEGATPLPERVRTVTEYYAGMGAFGPLPFTSLRVTIHSVNMSVAAMEEFYRKRWPKIQFDRDKQEDPEAEGAGTSAAHLEWSGTDLVASATTPDKIKGVPSGVIMTISDLRSLQAGEPEGSAERIAGESVVMFLNFRDFNGYRP